MKTGFLFEIIDILMVTFSIIFGNGDIADMPPAVEQESETIIEEECFGKYGWALDAGEITYYWRFSGENMQDGGLFADINLVDNSSFELIRLKNGTETVVATMPSASEIAVTHDKVFFGEDSMINCITHDGKERHAVVNGVFCDITEDGKYLIYYSTYKGHTSDLYALDTSSFEIIYLASSTRYIANRDGVVYHSPNGNTPGTTSLHAVNIQTGEDRLICTPPTDEEWLLLSSSSTEISHIRFDDEYIYFSHGIIQGSGAFYDGKEVIRVKYDGSDFEVLTDLIGPEFTVNPDGSVTQNNVPSESNHKFRRTHIIDREGNILWFDEVTGAPIVVSSCFPDENYDMSTADFVSVTDKYVFFITHYCIHNPEKSVGWRDFYEREKSIFYMVDRESGEIVTSYEF